MTAWVTTTIRDEMESDSDLVGVQIDHHQIVRSAAYRNRIADEVARHFIQLCNTMYGPPRVRDESRTHDAT